MPKLHEILAIEKDVKAKAKAHSTECYRKLEKVELFVGREKQFHPSKEDGRTFDPESQHVRESAMVLVASTARAYTEAMNVNYAKARGNTVARADVVVGDTVLLKDVPVPFLLDLETALNDMTAFIAKAPTLSSSEVWSQAEGRNNEWRTDERRRERTEKRVKHKVIVQPTEAHPAQVVEYSEDEVIGHWVETILSRALSLDEKEELTNRCARLRRAVKQARERANAVEVEKCDCSSVFNYLLGDPSAE